MAADGYVRPDRERRMTTGNSRRERSLERIREVYRQRMRRRDQADARNPDRNARTDRIKAEGYRRLLDRNGLLPLNSRDILDVGCQWGTWLAQCRQEWGQQGGRLCGIELMEEWVARGRELCDFLDLRCGSADRLPWVDDSFDIVHQAMLLSSVLDPKLRQAIAAEMQRMVRPGGYVLWYDFFWNPINPDTVGMTLGRVRALFPDWLLIARARVTLAPPLSRIIERIWGRGVDLLSRISILNAYYLILLRKPG